MAILEVQDIQKSFGKTVVLKGISFSLEQGDVLSVIGSSGSGKTTLLRCLNFLETADSGVIRVSDEVIFDGSNTAALTDKQVRENRLHFGLVFQNFNLFPQYTALENVCLASRLQARERPDYKANRKEILAKIEARGRDLLDQVGLSAKCDSYPCQLSGGQQQRVAIARALAMQPQILCFDEPTSALDPELTEEVLQTILDLRKEGRTMIVVTHEMGFAKSVADVIMFIADGVIEEMGTPEQLFDHPESEKTRSFLQHAKVEWEAMQ